MKKRSLTQNYIYNLLYQILLIILPIAVTPYISRTLGANGVGIYSYTTSIVTYFIMLGTFGLNMYGQREIAKVQEDTEQRSKLFKELFLSKFITISISTLFYFIFFCINNEYSLYYRILLLELVAAILDISWFFQGMEDFKKVAIRNIFSKILSIVAIFIFVKKPEDIWIYLLLYGLSIFIGNISMFWDIKKYVIKVKKINILKHLKPMFLLLIPQIAVQIYTVLDKTMLGMILNDMNEVGYYEQAQKIVKLSLSLVTTFGAVMLPRISHIYASGNTKLLKENIFRSFRFVWFLATPIAVGIFILSDQFVPWFFGSEFLEVASLLKILSIMVVIISLSNVLGHQFLVATSQQNKYTIAVSASAVLNVILNIILIPFTGAIGACIASVAAELTGFLLQCFFVRKTFSLKNIFSNSTLYIFSAGIMGIIVWLYLNYFNSATIYCTFIAIIIGVCSYTLYLFIFQDEFLKLFLEKLKFHFKKEKKNS